jgi:FkbM family methyltransferase
MSQTNINTQTIVDNIRHVSANIKMPRDHIDYLKKLKTDGFEPKVIYDIGSCVGHWTKEAKEIWPDAIYYLFEGNRDVEFLYKEKSDPYFIGILSNQSGKIVKWYENKMLFGGNSYYRENDDRYFPESNHTYRITHALDDVVSSLAIPPPDLVKIDVQGAEKDIIAGGIKSLSKATHLVIEIQDVDYNIGAPKAHETIPYIEKVLNVKCVAPKLCDNGPDADYGFTKTFISE